MRCKNEGSTRKMEGVDRLCAYVVDYQQHMAEGVGFVPKITIL
jgi:hypothetical protein